MSAAADHDHDLAVEMFGTCVRCDARQMADARGVELPKPHPDFDGATYVRANDRTRLGAQAQRVWDVMVRGAWLTLAELAARTGDPEASVSARLRDFRKDGWGGHVVERRHRGPAADGLYEYRLAPAQQQLQDPDLQT